MIDTHWPEHINALLYRIQREDKAALQELYHAAGPKLLALKTRILSNHHEAEEALQELFVKIWQQSKKYTGTGSAWGWICVMARNTAIDRLRSVKSRSHASTDQYPELLNELVDETNADQTHWIGRCLKQLKPEVQRAIVMCYMNGYSHTELSQKMAAPLGTVKTWIRGGLQELQQCLRT